MRGKKRLLSVMLCAALVGTSVPQYGMSVHAAHISDAEVISDTVMEISLTVTMSKAEYEAGSELKPEDLTVEYRGADGETTVLSYQSDDSASGYGTCGEICR